MLNIGCHLSTSKGFRHMGEDTLSIGANTFQFFTRNPRGSKAKKIDENDIKELIQITEKHRFAPLSGHAPYTLNPCSADERIREFALEVMADDLARMEYLPGNLYNFHPGSHVGQGIDHGIDLITEALNTIIKPTQTTTVLLETMSGKGSEVGSSFEELQEIFKRMHLNEKMGVCFDTCHVYDAGYDIVNDLDGVLDEFDRIIGLDKLYAIHLNDSMNQLSSHKDRHAKIGEGKIGLDSFERIINHPKLRHLPFYLETPNELPGYQQEIRLLQSLFHEE